MAGVEEDRLQVRNALLYTVRYAAVGTFRFSLPKEVAERSRVQGAGVKEQSRAPDPSDPERVITTVVLQAPVLGAVPLAVEYDLPGEPLAAGGAREVAVPVLRAVGVEREQGWYAVTRDPALSVEGRERNLVYADVREVPAFAGAGDAFLAWRWLSHPHGLTLAVARHEPVPILQAVVNALALDTLVGGGSVALTEVRMDVQVNGLQYLRVELPAGAAVESAEVDGRPVSPRTEGAALLLPCPPGKGRDDRFGVRLVYREDAAGAVGRWFTVDLAAPRVPEALVQATAWTTWVPPDAVFFSGGGNLRPAENPSVLQAVLDALGEVFGAGSRAGRPTAGGGALPPQVTLAVAGRTPFSFQRTGEEAHRHARVLPPAPPGALPGGGGRPPRPPPRGGGRCPLSRGGPPRGPRRGGSRCWRASWPWPRDGCSRGGGSPRRRRPWRWRPSRWPSSPWRRRDSGRPSGPSAGPPWCSPSRPPWRGSGGGR